MTVMIKARHGLVASQAEKTELEAIKKVELTSKSPQAYEITRLNTSSTSASEPLPNTRSHSTYHIYSKREGHKCITLVPDPTRDRRIGPTTKQLRAERKQPPAPDPTAFFVHKPYLAFHVPPHVLYTGTSEHNTQPTVLIHQPCLWRTYKLQLGPSLAEKGVLDPRGVVSWRHNGGDKNVLKTDDAKLKGYRVRTWRLWGETGKAYVQSVKETRRLHDEANDPDVLKEEFKPACADEVVHLRWVSPFSRHTRCYHFHYRGVDFYWKGTGTVKESRMCGFFMRFNHLKLVARLPLACDSKKADGDAKVEFCLAKFTSSVAKMKSGVLDVFDAAILRLVKERLPGMLDYGSFKRNGEESENSVENHVGEEMVRLKKSTLYQLIVATAICMVSGEKEKRHTLLDLLLQAAEGGGGAGG